MEQPISKLATSPNFHMTASEPQLIPPRLEFLSTSYGRSSGSSSTEFGRSWEDRILDLSAELQQICGSPLSPSCFVGNSPGTGSPEVPQCLTTSTTTAAIASPSTPRLIATSPRIMPSTVVSSSLVFDQRSGHGSTTTPPRPSCSIERSNDGSSTADLFRRTISLQCGQSTEAVSGRHRPIMVRHEETQERLAKRLSAICGKSSLSSIAGINEQEATATPEESQSASKLRADVIGDSTVSNRLMIKVDVDTYRAEDIVVSVSDDRILTVNAFNGSTVRRLHRAELPTGIADCLLCHMNSSGSLYILERPRGSGLTLEFSGSKSTFLPVIHCDEVQLVMTLVLRVPDDFRFEELAVKTVDNSVWITGGEKPGTSPQSSSSDTFTFPLRHGPRLTDAVNRRFKVVVPLPKGCDSRSVIAALLSNSQLVLRAKLRAACRRYTF